MSEEFHTITLLPRNFEQVSKGMTQADADKEYARLRKQFYADKGEFAAWIRKDRDSRMDATAKLVATYLVECLNFETGRCDPSYEAISDELGLSYRTVERVVPRIAAAGWVDRTRRGKTTTNFYTIRVAVSKVKALEELVAGLRQLRSDKRAERRQGPNSDRSDLRDLAGHSHNDPTQPVGHDPTQPVGHDPTRMGGKPMKGTYEAEPLNEILSTDSEGMALGGYGADRTDERHIPFTMPQTDDEAEEMVMAWLDGRPPRTVMALFDDIRERLSSGTLTPAELEKLLQVAA
ncbi:hypothetical protein X769_18265 [Mesorhizobium sp. LSJC268A00]|uniref:hypothetical protein n=1 Tax=unclassified Mesorhizobium TaxID=325217 RepID=UPI0003CE23B8|nr:hypothetical protein [Mesorhizobium sp. LSJC268A00]ESX03407.1 hypothetical protein X769_18265 [Mesorhizobium sp. LSJC268A00]